MGKIGFLLLLKKRREKKEKVISPQREANQKTSRWEIREEERGNDVFIYQFMSFAISDFELSHNGNGKEERERWRNIEKRLYYFPPFLPFFSSPLTYFFAARSKIVPSFPFLPFLFPPPKVRMWKKSRRKRKRYYLSFLLLWFPTSGKKTLREKGEKKRNVLHNERYRKKNYRMCLQNLQKRKHDLESPKYPLKLFILTHINKYFVACNIQSPNSPHFFSSPTFFWSICCCCVFKKKVWINWPALLSSPFFSWHTSSTQQFGKRRHNNIC